MKKHAKIFLVVALALIMCLSGITAFASEETPGTSSRLSHFGGAAFSFSALSSGRHVSVSYEGYEDSFLQAKLTVKLEKKYLLFFWKEVDTWSETNTDLRGDFYHVFSLDGKGLYKATMTLEVIGIDGTADVVSDYIESRYK